MEMTRPTEKSVFGVNGRVVAELLWARLEGDFEYANLNTGLVDVNLYWNLTQVRFFLLVVLAPAYVKARRNLSTNKPSLSTLEI